MDSKTTAKEFLNIYFPDCDGAMVVHPEKNKATHIEIIIFYHNINTHYHKKFNFRETAIDVKVYRTSNCSFLSTDKPSPQTDALASLLSAGIIIKDYNHEVETILAEARTMREKEIRKNSPIYKRIESGLFSFVCL